VAVTGEQPHALSLALNDQAIAVVFDFVESSPTLPALGSPSRNAGFKRVFRYDRVNSCCCQKIVAAAKI
jgi:hypothetical protein